MSKENIRETYTSVEVAEMFDLSRITLDRWIKEGKIPRPMKDSTSRQNIWTQADLDALAQFIKNKESQ